ADLKIARRTECDRAERELVRINFDDGQVLIRRHSDNFCAEPFAMLGDAHLELKLSQCCLGHDVKVGNDVPSLIPDDSRAAPLGNLHHIDVEEIPSGFDRLTGSDVYHGRGASGEELNI